MVVVGIVGEVEAEEEAGAGGKDKRGISNEFDFAFTRRCGSVDE